MGWIAAVASAAMMLAPLASPPCALSQDEAETPPCSSDPHFALLDFWLGDWDVFVKDQKAGESHIEKILSGCAITEDWTSVSGQHGHSLFYYYPPAQTWKQVWVTGTALGRGGVKEKEMIARLPYGGGRFLGKIYQTDGSYYLDRTTLTPEGETVHQLIEISTDGGHQWQTTFDAIYRRKK